MAHPHLIISLAGQQLWGRGLAWVWRNEWKKASRLPRV
jgi:hypothetical protein